MTYIADIADVSACCLLHALVSVCCSSAGHFGQGEGFATHGAVACVVTMYGCHATAVQPGSFLPEECHRGKGITLPYLTLVTASENQLSLRGVLINARSQNRAWGYT